MTRSQIKILLIIATFIWGLGVGTLLKGESRPVSKEGQSLQIELDAYVTKHAQTRELGADYMQYATLVLPELELDSPAIVYRWPVPHTTRGEHEMWVVLFTFHEKEMLMMEPWMRNVVAAHEVGHVEPGCMSFHLDTRGLNDFEAAIAHYQFQVLVESCADTVASELTTVGQVLNGLLWLRKTFHNDGAVLNARIQVMTRMMEREVLESDE